MTESTVTETIDVELMQEATPIGSGGDRTGV